MVHEKKWRDAKEFYSKAIAVLTDISDHQWERGQDPELDAKQQKILEEQCYTNRALCNLELSTGPCCHSSGQAADMVKRTIDRPQLIALLPSG